MGGSALKQIKVQRLDAPAFHTLAQWLVDALGHAFPGMRAAVIPAYTSKPDFGDIDILIAQERLIELGGRDALKDWATRTLFAREFAPNGNVLSLDYRAHPEDEVGFQVDFINVPAAQFDITLSYFSYNDLGNLIGRTAHAMGFSYGHAGLVYPFRDGNHLFATLSVSESVDDALPFLGYDAARFHRGFADLPEIFDYVTGSSYFNREIFLLENRNHTSRVRDRKRPTYRKFLEHLEAHPDLPQYVYEPDKATRHAQFLTQAFAWFPQFEHELRATEERLARSRFVREHMPGDKIQAWTGLEGKELGQFIRGLKESVGGTQAWVDLLRAEGEAGLEARVRQLLAAPTPRPRY